MIPAIALFVVFFSSLPLAAQNRPSTLSTLFEDIYGPNGLVLNSDDVQLDGTNHAAHFNSAFQSEFRLVNVALTSQLATVPLPSPASGFTYNFDPATGTFMRSTRSFGPILAERGETIGRGKIAFGYSYQFFSYDALDGVRLASIPAVFTHDNPQAGGGRADVVATANTVEATVNRFTGALTYGLSDRVDISLARADRGHTAVPALERDHSPDRHRQQSGRPLLQGSGCHRRTRIDEAVFRRRIGRGRRRPGGPRQDDDDAGRRAGARGGARRPHADR